MQQSSRYQFIDGMRGLAAMAVVLFHIGRDFLGIDLLYYGKHGVTVFFVISGFVICHALNGKTMTCGFVGKFMLRRSIRLDPTYWFCILLALLVLWLPAQILNYSVELPSLSSIGLHALYLQDLTNTPPINVVFWTLCYEIQFYLVICILFYAADAIARKRSHDCAQIRFYLLIPVLALSLLWPLELTHWLFAGDTRHGLFIDFWYLFLLGVFAYLAIDNTWARGLLIVSTMILLIISDSLAALIGASTALLFLIAGLGRGLKSWLSWRWVQFLGLISYSLYLSHDIVGLYMRDTGLHLTNKYLGLDHPTLTAVWVLICIALSVGFAFLLYRVIERPTHQWSRKII